MGSISYDGMVVAVDDRTLTHLQIVIVNKLRRNEAFLMSWKDSAEVGSGRSAIWLHPYVLVRFQFTGSRVPAINDRWLQELATSADSSRGLVVTNEHGDIPALPMTGHPARNVRAVAPSERPKPQAARPTPRSA